MNIQFNTEAKYTFSVIIPVYNIEDYLDEAVESIINQTIGFRENIQLILVNDGSKDNSGEICSKYQNLYPENVLYIKKENGGVSSARNEGLKNVNSKYVAFLDGDDKWAEDAFEQVFDFFEKHYNEIDAVSCRHCFFEKQTGFTHALDYKYQKKAVVDIDEEYSFIQMAVNNIIVRADALKDLEFDTRLKISEDSIFAAKIILKKRKCGILPSAVYYYRKRYSDDSAIDTTIHNKSWYINTLIYSYMELFNYSIQNFGKVIPYCQYQVMYDIQWRIKGKISETLTEEERRSYINYIKELLQFIDVKIIMEQKNLSFAHKLFALKLKYGKDIFDGIAYRKEHYFKINDVSVFNVKAKNRLLINILELKGDRLIIEGMTHLSVLGERYTIGVMNSTHEFVPFNMYPVKHKDKFAFTGEKIFSGTGFKIEVNVKIGDNFNFVIKDNENGQFIQLKPYFGDRAKLSTVIKGSYYTKGKYLLKLKNNVISISGNSIKNHFNAELRYIKNLLKQHEIKIVIYRVAAKFIKKLKNKEIWIISDRTDFARDNGKAFFKYAVSVRDRKKDISFALDKNSPDFFKIKKIGSVLKLNSFLYKIKFLCADKIISAHADKWVINAFGNNVEYVKDLYDFKFVFLQHGIIQNDLSGWLHKQNRNIQMFVTSTEREWESIINGEYDYDENIVKLTGLPRYDLLDNNKQKKIIIIPTWRKDIAEPLKKGTSIRPYSAGFKHTDYFEFYNALINDNTLITKMKENGYIGEFYVHPAFENQITDFQGNDIISVRETPDEYNKLFGEAALLVTDYSSIAFDFSYMKKPVIYSQYDADIIHKIHTFEKGYYDYETDGFGPVCNDYDTTVQAIIDCINNDCLMEEEYHQRVDEFFKWRDKNNCKRVYEAILNM